MGCEVGVLFELLRTLGFGRYGKNVTNTVKQVHLIKVNGAGSITENDLYTLSLICEEET